MFLDRRSRGPDPWLALKMALFVAGALFAMTGVALGRSWLIDVALGLLAAGLLLRLLRTKKSVEEP